jgi:hypothetical protein
MTVKTEEFLKRLMKRLMTQNLGEIK